MVILQTSVGPLHIELDEARAPKTCANFLQYVADGHYHGTIFHRVIDGFMIQGGGFMPDMQQKPTREPIENEAANGLRHEIGTLAMARTNLPHSASSQFFINVANNAFLNHPGQDGWGYCVFGRVVEGMDVINKIKSVATTSQGGHRDVPVEPVVIESAVVVSNPA
ncbi:peptidyl-prolyl cis-trans isomerase B [Gammaproteobacteria bacterium]